MARRSNKRYILNSPLSLLSTILVAMVIVPMVVLPFVEALGGVDEIIIDLVGILPFGDVWYAAAVLVGNSILDQVVNVYSLKGVFTVSYVIQELSEGIFTVIIYEALRLLVMIPMGLNDPMNKGRWNGIKRIIVNITMAVIAACLAPALINWLFTNMGVLSQGWRTVISALVSTILLGGGVAFFVLLSGLAVGQSVIYVAVKFFIVGAVRLAGSYVFLMLLLLAWQNRVWTLFTGALSGFLAVMVLMAAVELMIDSMFGN